MGVVVVGGGGVDLPHGCQRDRWVVGDRIWGKVVVDASGVFDVDGHVDEGRSGLVVGVLDTDGDTGTVLWSGWIFVVGCPVDKDDVVVLGELGSQSGHHGI